MRPSMNLPAPRPEPHGLSVPAPGPRRLSGSGSAAVLVVARGPHLPSGTTFPLAAAVTALGRNPKGEIVLNDYTVSHRHAEIRRQGTIFQLLDTGSLNGTYVNRHPVSEAELADGDEIQIGRFRLTFRLDIAPGP